MKVPKNHYLLIYELLLFMLLIAGGCTEPVSEKSPQTEEDSAPEKTLSTEINPVSSASVISLPLLKKENVMLGSEKEEELKNRISLKELFHADLTFTENKGQLEKFYGLSLNQLGGIKYYTQAFGGTAYFCPDGIGFGFIREDLDLRLQGKRLKRKVKPVYETIGFQVKFLEKNKKSVLIGADEKTGKINFFKGKEEDFITGISSFDGVMYKDIYPFIDLKYYVKNGTLLFDYVVKPGAKVSDIKLGYEHVNGLKINKNGELEIITEWGALIDKKPYSYQIINGVEKEVDVRYKKLSGKTIGFEVKGAYDKSKELIIDPPTMSFSTFVGSSNDGYVHDMAIDGSGNIYGCGWYTSSFPNPAPASTYDNTLTGGADATVFKLNSTGTAVIHASYIGGDAGSGDTELAWGIDVDATGRAFVTGTVNIANNFPITAGVVQSTIAGNQDIFVTVLNAAGTGLVYSTFFGGANEDRAFSIAQHNGEAYVTGVTYSTGLATAGAYKTTISGMKEGFVMKLNTTGTAVSYFTYYGGSNEDMPKDIAVNTSGEAYIVGATTSTTDIATAGSFDNTHGGDADGFVAKFNSTGTNLVWGAYAGGSNQDRAESIALKGNGEVVVGGFTRSSNFPSVNAYQATNGAPGGGPRDAFMMRIAADGASLLNSTYIGTAGEECTKTGDLYFLINQHKNVSVDVNAAGNIVLSMVGDGGLTTVNAVDATFNGTGGPSGLDDNWIFAFNPDGQTVEFATYLGGSQHDYPTGGIKFDPSDPDCIVVVGCSHSDHTTFPTTAGVFKPTRIGAADEYYVTKYCEVILPVDFKSFNATATNEKTVLIEWETTSEKNNAYFIIERSKDGINFEPVKTIRGAGNSAELIRYEEVDETPYAGISYYRITQVDYNGKSASTNKKAVKIDLLGTLTLAPNPASNNLAVKTFISEASEITISLSNVLGQELSKYVFSGEKGAFEQNIDISSLAKGMYSVKMVAGEEMVTEMLIKQ